MASFQYMTLKVRRRRRVRYSKRLRKSCISSHANGAPGSAFEPSRFLERWRPRTYQSSSPSPNIFRGMPRLPTTMKMTSYLSSVVSQVVDVSVVATSFTNMAVCWATSNLQRRLLWPTFRPFLRDRSHVLFRRSLCVKWNMHLRILLNWSEYAVFHGA